MCEECKKFRPALEADQFLSELYDILNDICTTQQPTNILYVVKKVCAVQPQHITAFNPWLKEWAQVKALITSGATYYEGAKKPLSFPAPHLVHVPLPR